MVKRLPAMWETWVRFLGREDPLEKEMAIHSSTLAWKIPWTEEPDRLHSPWGHNESDTTERLHFKDRIKLIQPHNYDMGTCVLFCKCKIRYEILMILFFLLS